MIDNLLPGYFNNILDEKLLQLNFSKTKADKEIVWIMGHYVQQAWEYIYLEERETLSRDKMFGFLKYKYRQEQIHLGLNIPELT